MIHPLNTRILLILMYISYNKVQYYKFYINCFHMPENKIYYVYTVYTIISLLSNRLINLKATSKEAAANQSVQ